MTGIPLFKLEEEESNKLLRMEEFLHKRVIGRTKPSRRSREPFADPGRPRSEEAYRLLYLSSDRPVSENRTGANPGGVPLQ